MSKFYFEKSFVISGTDAKGERVYLTNRASIPFQGLRELPQEFVASAVEHALTCGLFSADPADALVYEYEIATDRPVAALARLSQLTQVSGITVERRKRRRFV